MFTSGILLAAGSATRMGAEKLQLLYRGRRLIDRALASLVGCRLIEEVVVVVRPDLRLVADHPKCRMVVNPDHGEGMGSSLRTGVAAANPVAEVFVVSLADMPELTAEIVTELIEAYANCGKKILVPMYQGRHGHPVVLAGSCRSELLGLGGDVGARQIIEAQADRVEYFETPYRAVVYDVDTPEDL
jgi:molybdenum cofactor cytidylyltransferase